MATISKSQEQASSDMVGRYTAEESGTTPDTSPGSVNLDIIDTVAQSVSDAYSELETAREMASLKNAGIITSDGMSQIGLNYDMVQLAATKATGTIWFQKTTAPSGRIDFPIGTVVRTQKATDGTSVKFLTTTSASLTTSTSINPANRRYEVSASIIAVDAGSDGNVGPGSINSLDTPNRNIDAVVNKEGTTGGTDLEDNSVYAARILDKTTGTTVGTHDGYVALITEQFPTVTQIGIAGPTDPIMLRKQWGNEVDVYVLVSTATNFTDSIRYTGSTSQYFSVHPVLTVSSIVGTTVSYALNTDVRFDKDTSVAYGYSAKSLDKITWISSNRPPVGAYVTVTGTYDSAIAEIQSYLDTGDVRFVTSDLLVKSATEIGIVMTIQVTTFSGYNRTAVGTAVSTAVTDALADYGMGQDVAQSDIISIIGSVEGVDDVTVPITNFRKTTDSVGTSSDVIAISTAEYARISTITVTAV